MEANAQDKTVVDRGESSESWARREWPLLIRLSDPGKGLQIRLTGKAQVLGRDPGCEIVVDEDRISRRHVEVRLEGQSLHVRDLGSTNGTFVDGIKKSSGRLPLGGTLRVGPSALFKFTFKDETELRQEEKLRRHATRDSLTGLMNRASFTESAFELIERSRRKGLPWALVICDIDHFKNVNDTYGHPAGDAALIHVAGILARFLRRSDICGRLGGEEFALLLPETDADAAVKGCERIRLAIESSSVTHEGKILSVRLSLGALVCEADTDLSLEKATALADSCLYEAKRSGRNRLVARTLTGKSFPPRRTT